MSNDVMLKRLNIINDEMRATIGCRRLPSRYVSLAAQSVTCTMALDWLGYIELV